jgi:integrase
MREGEILALRWEDIDLENNEINISRTVNYIKGKSIPGKPKTDNARRSITLPKITVEILKEIKDQETGLVFATSTGNYISHRNLLRHFHASLEKAGIPRMRFHD